MNITNKSKNPLRHLGVTIPVGATVDIEKSHAENHVLKAWVKGGFIDIDDGASKTTRKTATKDDK